MQKRNIIIIKWSYNKGEIFRSLIDLKSGPPLYTESRIASAADMLLFY